MLINQNTRIADLIKHDKRSIDAIASLAKPLEKLKNPILRKIMASRVTVAEAAKMGGCGLDDFACALQPLGFEFLAVTPKVTPFEEMKPSWLLALTPKTIDTFDVRELLASGEDPLKQIIYRFKEVKAGHALCIINNFIPTPLVRLLEKDGVKSYTETVHPTEYHSYFFKESAQEERDIAPSSSNRIFMDSPQRFTELQSQFSTEKTNTIDVRHLEMPEPMQIILQELSVLANDSALYVIHKRIPIYLLEALAELDMEVHVLNRGENDVKLFIFHR